MGEIIIQSHIDSQILEKKLLNQLEIKIIKTFSDFYDVMVQSIILEMAACAYKRIFLFSSNIVVT